MKILKSSVLPVCVLALALAGCKTDPAGSGAGGPSSTSFKVVLTTEKNGGANGTVTSSPAGISCDTSCPTASSDFPARTEVTLTAVPSAATPANYFVGWEGFLGCGSAPTCSVSAIGGVTINIKAKFSKTPPAADVLLLTSTNKLISFSYADPARAVTGQTIAVAAGETVIGIDYAPSDVAGTEVLIGVAKKADGSGTVFRINANTGAIIGGETALTTAAGGPFTGFSGTRFGVDYNPVTTTMRVVSDTGQNLSIGMGLLGIPAGRVFIEGTLADRTGASPLARAATGAAYTNNYFGTKGTILYVLDQASKRLFVQNNVLGNVYQIASIDLPAGTTEVSDFDMRGTGTQDSSLLNPETNADAVFVARVNGDYGFYHLNIATGETTRISGPVAPAPIPTPLSSIANPISEGAISVALRPGAALPQGDTYAINDRNELLTFNRATPGAILTRNAIPRLYSPARQPASDDLIGFDFRPGDGLLYGVSQQGGIYTINPVTGLGSFVADLHDSGSSVTKLPAGTEFGVSFNPVDNTLRLVSNTTTNWTADLSGTVTVQPTLHRGSGASATAARLTAAAHSNDLPAASKTTIYGIDTSSGASAVLATVHPTNGTVTNVGSLGVAPADGNNGFDIDGLTGIAYAILTSGTTPRLYTISLTSGAATDLGRVGARDEVLLGLALKLPQVTAYGLTTTGNLIAFDPANPSVTPDLVRTQAQLGGEKLVTLDYRASDNKLFGVSAAGNIYRIDPTVAAPVATFVKQMLNFDDNTAPQFSSFGAATDFGSDFDPRASVDSAGMRIVAAGNPAQNLRVNVVSGSTFSDGNLAVDNTAPPIIGALFPDACDDSAAPQVGGIAFSNNLATVSSTLYAINANTDCLYTVAANGAMTAIDTLGVTTTPTMGFDIAGVQDGVALAALDTGASQSILYAIDLATGKASARGLIGTAATGKLAALTIAVRPAP